MLQLSDVLHQADRKLFARSAARILVIDAARGLLALIVVLTHIAAQFGLESVRAPADYAVVVFFAISGFVLARSYDGRPMNFLLRRFVRLWPLYAACILAGYAILNVVPPPHLGEFFWWPMLPLRITPIADRPAWSLYYEAWATPGLVVLVSVARRNRVLALALTILILLSSNVFPRMYYFSFFAIGMAAATFQFDIPHIRLLQQPVLLWLGRVSFSLYMTHSLVIMISTKFSGPWGAVASFPAMLLVAWGAWWLIERPSAWLSRRIA